MSLRGPVKETEMGKADVAKENVVRSDQKKSRDLQQCGLLTTAPNLTGAVICQHYPLVQTMSVSVINSQVDGSGSAW